jgi:3-methyladenine DNA glycosylase AlkD
MENEFKENLINLRNELIAKTNSSFFKTGKGQYSEHDVFLGVRVPKIRKLVKVFYDKYTLNEIVELLKSKYHEIRLGALLILVKRYEKSDFKIKKEIYKIYIKNVKYINNWDLVDLTSPNIVGDYIYNWGDYNDLWKLAKSSHLWSERISIVSSLYFIRHNNFDYALDIAAFFLPHTHDLIHKATGWILREVGKRDKELLYKFLDGNVNIMPRTTLRYAIEKFDEDKRQYYLKLRK